jgi:hypothetical protein
LLERNGRAPTWACIRFSADVVLARFSWTESASFFEKTAKKLCFFRGLQRSVCQNQWLTALTAMQKSFASFLQKRGSFPQLPPY